MFSTFDAASVHRVCEVAAGGSLRPGSAVAEVQVRGTQVVLAYRLNVPEIERRTSEAITPVLDRGLLEGLLQLPEGLPVPATSLTRRERDLLRHCPPTALERRGEMLVRRAVRPLRVDLAVVRSPRSRRGVLARAGRFGAYTSTAVLLDGATEGADILVMEASVYGIGVVRRCIGEAPELLMAPRGLPKARHTSAGWLFAEQVYQELTKASRVPQPIP